MNRRLFAVAALAAVMTASAHGAGAGKQQDPAALPQPQPGRQLQLHALFAHAPGVEQQHENGMIVSGPTHADVILARIDTDGKLVKVCVDSEEAARRFLNAPVEKLDGGRKAKEQ
jgi:hypothetical protein